MFVLLIFYEAALYGLVEVEAVLVKRLVFTRLFLDSDVFNLPSCLVTLSRSLKRPKISN